MPVRLNWKHHMSPGATGSFGSNSGKMPCVGWMLLAGQRSSSSSFLKHTLVFLKTEISFGSNASAAIVIVSVTWIGFQNEKKERCAFAAYTPAAVAMIMMTVAVMRVFLFMRKPYKQIDTLWASASRSAVDLPVSGLRANVR